MQKVKRNASWRILSFGVILASVLEVFNYLLIAAAPIYIRIPVAILIIMLALVEYGDPQSKVFGEAPLIKHDHVV